MKKPIEPISVLVVDDDADDRLLARDLLREIQVVKDVRTVKDGDELFDYLRRRGQFATLADWQRPDVILLDLYMPKRSGFEVLENLKSDPELAPIPVVVLTGSETSSDVQRAYDLGAGSYMVEPLTLQRVVVGLRSKKN